MKIVMAALLILLSFLTLSIGVFQQYLILSKIGADRLMWFLFWFNVPMIVVIQILSELIKKIGIK